MSYARSVLVLLVVVAVVAGAVMVAQLQLPSRGAAAGVDEATGAVDGWDDCDPLAMHGLHFSFAPSRLFGDRSAASAGRC